MARDHIQISKINDFIFCPKSIYLHSIYEKFTEKIYHEKPQTVGKIKHANIDRGKYSTARRYVQGLEVYCDKYGLVGKIDIYDQKTKSLVERKYKISKIYDGYRFQLYAQYFALVEMGYEVNSLYLHSLSDNKRYSIDIPEGKELVKFEETIKAMRNFHLDNNFKQNPNKCVRCIYKELC